MIYEFNCISFTYFALGLRKRESFIDSQWPIYHYREFEKVNSKDKGIAIAVIFDVKIKERGRKPVAHMAVIDQKNNNFVWQRRSYGGNIEHISMSEMLEVYSRGIEENKVSMVFLALSEIGRRKKAENSGNNYLISRLYSKS